MKRATSLTRRQFLVASSAALAAAAWRRGALRPEPPPNLVLIVSDDQAPEDLGCFGNATIGTPAIDKLASEGLRFTRAFTPTAICAPSRSCIHTGLHGTTSGASGFSPIKPGIPTLSTVLKQAGYRTALIGKMHLAPIEQFQFDFLKPSAELSGGRDVDAIQDAARSFVKESVAAKTPFFLNVNFDDPHYPWPLTREEAEADESTWEAEAEAVDPRNRALGDVAGTHPPDKVRLPALLPDVPAIRRELSRYCDAITRLDRGVGLILRMLERQGVAERTVVVFVSDNGMDFPFHKATLWEGGIHLPLIARWPGVTPPGATCDGMVSFVDLMPTFLDIAGATPPARQEGRSFRAALDKPETPLREEVFLTHTRGHQKGAMPTRGLRTQRFKYLRNLWKEGSVLDTVGMEHASWAAVLAASRGDPELNERVERWLRRPPLELYDLQADPLEKKNLADDPDHAEVRRQLHDRLKATMVSIKDGLHRKL